MPKFEEAEAIINQVIYSRQPLKEGDIQQVVTEFWGVLTENYYGFSESDFEGFVSHLKTKYVTSMGIGVSLIDNKQTHNENWFKDREISWDYWMDYERYLISQQWPTRVVFSMNNVTDKILGLLEDPERNGEWERRGLVIGHVQSGKTANYIGLASKAADAGYKFIIVIAGIHNNLRTQTQSRIDAGFIGRDSSSKELIGVGLLRQSRAMPVTVTTTESDFNKSVAKRFGMELNSLNNTFILVIKKNVSTLKNLYTWLKQLNTREGLGKITDIPMLMIDDEADHASINTNKPDLDPTRTNQEIRNILNLFNKRSYVGYTATPFANIFIDPDDTDNMLGNNLFPEHFIFSLDPPTNYAGYETLFLDESQSDNYIREIDDMEDYIPLRHRIGDPIEALPPTLKRAIRLFILSRAIRNIRGQHLKHHSMMINVSRFVRTQGDIRLLTEMYVDRLQKIIRYSYRLPVDVALKDNGMNELYKDFIVEYATTKASWQEVQEELNNAASSVQVILVNSRSMDVLDYKVYENEGAALTAIAIGGLSLSRGLTLEGLTISYIYRNSKMYDTLMQMGRWFGYRKDYGDLCRIYMSDESYGWYCHIAEATEELRTQIIRMQRERRTPSDFGLYVRAHPDTLIVTARNKMRYTENRLLKVSYNGSLEETYILPDSTEKNDHNRDLIVSLFDELHISQSPTPDNTKSYCFTDVNWSFIHNFLLNFRFHLDMVEFSERIPQYIYQVADLYPKWDVVFKSIATSKPDKGYMIAAQERTVGYEIKHIKLPPSNSYESGYYTGNKQRFSGNSMFKIGLDKSRVDYAQELAEEASRKKPIYVDYTNSRGKPVLLVHLLRLLNSDRKTLIDNVPALNINFPLSNHDRPIECVVGKVWLRQFEHERYDSPDEEDDYD